MSVCTLGFCHDTSLFVNNSVKGGCDGCVDPNNPSNAGPMLDLLPLLDDFYRKEQLSKEMSKADLYALTGIVAVQEGIKNANVGCRGYTCLPMVCVTMDIFSSFRS